MPIKSSNTVRALLVLMTFSAPSAAQNITSGNDFSAENSDPLTIDSPNSSVPGIGQGQGSGQGFSGFVNEVRDAVRTPRNVPLPRQNDGPAVAAPDTRPQLPDPTYESSIPIRVGQDSSSGGSAEIFLGVSVKQIVGEIPPTAPIIGEAPPATEKRAAAPGKIIGSAGGGGSAGTGGNWLGGGFLSAEGSGGGSGFGFDLRPMAFPTDVGDPNYRGPGRNEEEVSKSLKRLRRIVLDLVFNPFVYFGCLIVSVLMFMARFRTG